MNNKQSKKMRREFREQFNQLYRDKTLEMIKENAQFLKPKPKYFPMFLWVSALKIFIKIK